MGTATNWTDLELSHGHTCALNSDGEIWCWGRNQSGELGRGTQTSSEPTPAQTGNDSDWVFITTGGNHSCATKENGTLHCWGENLNSQLGDGTTNQGLSPVAINRPSAWKFLSSGEDSSHQCGIKVDGSLWCWGNGTQGQLGQGDLSSENEPVQVGSDTDWEEVQVGAGHTCGLKGSEIYCWGYNMSGQLGNNSTSDTDIPGQGLGSSDWQTLAVGSLHTCGIKTRTCLKNS